VLKKFTVAAGEAISLVAHKLGMKLFAAQGKLEIQAQSDAMLLASQKDLSVTSVDGTVYITGKQSVVLSSGGSYIKLEGGNIEIAGPADLKFKCAFLQKVGPASESMPGELKNSLPATPLQLTFATSPASKSVLPTGMPYRLFADGALVQNGVIDGGGQLPIAHQLATKAYRLELSNGAIYDIPVAENFRGDAANGERANQGFHYHQGAPDAGADAVDRAVHRQTYDALLTAPTAPEA